MSSCWATACRASRSQYGSRSLHQVSGRKATQYHPCVRLYRSGCVQTRDVNNGSHRAARVCGNNRADVLQSHNTPQEHKTVIRTALSPRLYTASMAASVTPSLRQSKHGCFIRPVPRLAPSLATTPAYTRTIATTRGAAPNRGKKRLPKVPRKDRSWKQYAKDGKTWLFNSFAGLYLLFAIGGLTLVYIYYKIKQARLRPHPLIGEAFDILLHSPLEFNQDGLDIGSVQCLKLPSSHY